MENLSELARESFDSMDPKILAIASKKKKILIYPSDPAKRYELGCLVDICWCESLGESKGCSCDDDTCSCDVLDTRDSCPCDDHSCDSVCNTYSYGQGR